MSFVKKKIIKLFKTLLHRKKEIIYPVCFNALQKSVINPQHISVKLMQDNSLGSAGDVIEVPFDVSTLNTLFCKGDWHKNIINLIRENIDDSVPYTVFDIGANIGLFSRQIFNTNISVERLVCFEPEINNFHFLKRNLKKYESITEIDYRNIALSDSAGVESFYKDDFNIGNYSLYKSAMGKDFEEVQVTSEDTAAVFDKFENFERCIIKTDTQGLDEKILTLIPDRVWDNVYCVVMELWNIKKDGYDHVRLALQGTPFLRQQF